MGYNLKFVSVGAVLLVVAAIAGCGRRGPLIPPEALVPAAIADLTVTQQGELFLLSWTAPAKEEGGRRLRDLAGFQLFKREVLAPAEDCEACPTAYQLLTTIDPEYLQGARRSGDRYLLEDAGLQPGKAYRYKVVSFTRDGARSKDSNKVNRKALVPPAPPVLRAISSSPGVRLEFTPAPSAAGAGPATGYLVYRQQKGEEFSPVSLTPKAVAAAVFEDQRAVPGITYLYRARSVSVVEGETVESALSSETIVTLIDSD